jgi:SPP1 family predicted phage head-tail adaptor
VLFTINYRPDVTTAHVVQFRGVLYDITRIDTFEGYKSDLTLYCSRRRQQENS